MPLTARKPKCLLEVKGKPILHSQLSALKNSGISNGDIVNEILRSENNHEKEYIVTVNRLVTDEFIAGMKRGVRLPELNITTKRCKVAWVKPKTFRIILTQGLNRQIRRMCAVFGYEVLRLQRVRIINIKLDGLKPGRWRDLKPAELKGLLPQRTNW